MPRSAGQSTSSALILVRSMASTQSFTSQVRASVAGDGPTSTSVRSFVVAPSARGSLPRRSPRPRTRPRSWCQDQQLASTGPAWPTRSPRVTPLGPDSSARSARHGKQQQQRPKRLRLASQSSVPGSSCATKAGFSRSSPRSTGSALAASWEVATSGSAGSTSTTKSEQSSTCSRTTLWVPST